MKIFLLIAVYLNVFTLGYTIGNQLENNKGNAPIAFAFMFSFCIYPSVINQTNKFIEFLNKI